jgi:hypothetical protein
MKMLLIEIKVNKFYSLLLKFVNQKESIIIVGINVYILFLFFGYCIVCPSSIMA